MERSFLLRELGRQRRDASLSADTALVRRMQQSSLDGHIAAVTTCAFNENGTLLVSSGDDTLIKLWDVHRGKAIHSFDSGHSQSIGCVRFMPDCGSTRVATGGADKQVRVIDLERAAIKPFAAHRAKVRALTAISKDIVLSAAEDGRVRRMDAREAAPPRSATRVAVEDFNARSLLVEQRMEVPHAATRMGIHTLAHDPTQPYYFATGGEDSLVRVYDMRYLRTPTTNGGALSSHRQATWAYCLVPDHLAPPRTHPSSLMSRRCQITGLAFSHSGHYLLASYSHEHVYSFNVKQHAQSRESLLSALSNYNTNLDCTVDWGPRPIGTRGEGGDGGARRGGPPAGDEGSDYERFAMWTFDPLHRGQRGGDTAGGRGSHAPGGGTRRHAGEGGSRPHTGTSPGSTGSAAAAARQQGPTSRSRLQPGSSAPDGSASAGVPGGVTTRQRAGGVHHEVVRPNAMRAAPGARPSAWLATIAEEPSGGAGAGTGAGVGAEEAQREGRARRLTARRGTSSPWALLASRLAAGRQQRTTAGVQQQQQGTDAEQQGSPEQRRRLRARRNADATGGEEGAGVGEEGGEQPGRTRAPTRQLSQDSSRIAQMYGGGSEEEVEQRAPRGQPEQQAAADGIGGDRAGEGDAPGGVKGRGVKQEPVASPTAALPGSAAGHAGQGPGRSGHQLTPPKLKTEKCMEHCGTAAAADGAAAAGAGTSAAVKQEPQEDGDGGAGAEGTQPRAEVPMSAAPPQDDSTRPRRRGRVRSMSAQHPVTDAPQPSTIAILKAGGSTAPSGSGAGAASTARAPSKTASRSASDGRRAASMQQQGVKKKTGTDTTRTQPRQQRTRATSMRNPGSRTIAPPDDSSTSSAGSESDPDPGSTRADILGAGALAAQRRAELESQPGDDDGPRNARNRPFMVSVTRVEPGTSTGATRRATRGAGTGARGVQPQPTSSHQQQQPVPILRRGRSANGATAGRQVADTRRQRPAAVTAVLGNNRGVMDSDSDEDEDGEHGQQQQEAEQPDVLLASGEDAEHLLQQAAGAVGGTIQFHLTVALGAPPSQPGALDGIPQEEGQEPGLGASAAVTVEEVGTGIRSFSRRRRRRVSEDGGPLLRPQPQRRRLRSSSSGAQASAGGQPPGDSDDGSDDGDGGSGNEGAAPHPSAAGPSKPQGPAGDTGVMEKDKDDQLPAATGRQKRGRAAAAGQQPAVAAAGIQEPAPVMRSRRTRRVTFADLVDTTSSSSDAEGEEQRGAHQGRPGLRDRSVRRRVQAEPPSQGGRADVGGADDDACDPPLQGSRRRRGQGGTVAGGDPSTVAGGHRAGATAGGLRLLREHILSTAGTQRRAGIDLPPRPPPQSSSTAGQQQPQEAGEGGMDVPHPLEEQQHTASGVPAPTTTGRRGRPARLAGPTLSLHLSPRVVNPTSGAAAGRSLSHPAPRAGSDEAFLRTLAPAQPSQQHPPTNTSLGAAPGSEPAAQGLHAQQATGQQGGRQASGAGGSARALREDGNTGLVTGLLRGAVRWAPLRPSNATAGGGAAPGAVAARGNTRSGTRRVGNPVWGNGPSDSSSEAEGSDEGEGGAGGQPGGNNDGPSAPAPWDGGANDPPLDVPGQGRRRRRAAAGGAAGEGPSEGLQGGLQGQEQEGGGQGDSGKGYHQVFKGHSNRQSVKEVTWLGNSSQFVASGSDDGGIYIWDAVTGRILSVLRPTPVTGTGGGGGNNPGEGDNEGSPLTAACLAAHPTELMLAACGSGRSVRVWTPRAEVAAPLPQPEVLQVQQHAAAAAAEAAAATAAEGLVFQLEQWMARVHMQGVQEELEQHMEQSRALVARVDQMTQGLQTGAPTGPAAAGGAGASGSGGSGPAGQAAFAAAMEAARQAAQAAAQATEEAFAAIRALAATATANDLSTIATRADAALQGVREAAAEAEAANQRARAALAESSTPEGAAGGSGAGGGEGGGQRSSWAARLQGLLRRRSFSGGGGGTPASGAPPSTSPGSRPEQAPGAAAGAGGGAGRRRRLSDPGGAGPSQPESGTSAGQAGGAGQQARNPGRGVAGSGGTGDESRGSASPRSPQGGGLGRNCLVM